MTSNTRIKYVRSNQFTFCRNVSRGWFYSRWCWRTIKQWGTWFIQWLKEQYLWSIIKSVTEKLQYIVVYCGCHPGWEYCYRGEWVLMISTMERRFGLSGDVHKVLCMVVLCGHRWVKHILWNNNIKRDVLDSFSIIVSRGVEYVNIFEVLKVTFLHYLLYLHNPWTLHHENIRTCLNSDILQIFQISRWSVAG